MKFDFRRQIKFFLAKDEQIVSETKDLNWSLFFFLPWKRESFTSAMSSRRQRFSNSWQRLQQHPSFCAFSSDYQS